MARVELGRITMAQMQQAMGASHVHPDSLYRWFLVRLRQRLAEAGYDGEVTVWNHPRTLAIIFEIEAAAPPFTIDSLLARLS
jgi:hypothetical protein